MEHSTPCLVPDPCDSLEAARRYAHADLAGLSDRQLWAERARVTHELARLEWRDRGYDRPRDPDAVGWLRARLRRLIDEERTRRRRRRR